MRKDELSFIGLCWPLLIWVLFQAGCSRMAQSARPYGSDQPNTESEAAKTEKESSVEVISIHSGEIKKIVQASANLEAEQTVRISSRISGVVKEVMAEEGKTVQTGELLLRLEDDTQRTQLEIAKTKAAQSLTQYERYKSLFQDMLISQEAFSDSQFQLKLSELSVEEAERELAGTLVKAPMAGTCLEMTVKVGDAVQANQPLFEVANLNSLRACIYLPEECHAFLCPGLPATVSVPALGGTTFLTAIAEISPVVDANSGTVKAILRFKNIGSLKPGMYADVNLELKRRSGVLIIPRKCLVGDGTDTAVFRVLRNGRVETVKVVPTFGNDEVFQAPDLFREGDLIVAAGHRGLKDGALIRYSDDTKR